MNLPAARAPAADPPPVPGPGPVPRPARRTRAPPAAARHPPLPPAARRATVVPATPSRPPISRSDSPCSRHCRARSRLSSPSARGRPGPSWLASAAAPCRDAAVLSRDTYAGISPNTSATRQPGNPSRRSVTITMFRIARSVPPYSATSFELTSTTTRPAARCRCRSRGEGTPSSMRVTAAGMPPSYRNQTISQTNRRKETAHQRHSAH